MQRLRSGAVLVLVAHAKPRPTFPRVDELHRQVLHERRQRDHLRHALVVRLRRVRRHDVPPRSRRVDPESVCLLCG